MGQANTGRTFVQDTLDEAIAELTKLSDTGGRYMSIMQIYYAYQSQELFALTHKQ
jgi:hypothetical protein